MTTHYDPEAGARTAKILRRAEALTTACPYCHAPPGEDCTIPRTGVTLQMQPAHYQRLWAVNEGMAGE